MAIPSIGDYHVDAVLFDLEENEFNISDFNEKNILLSFWSMRCMVCMKAARDLHKLNENHKEKLTIISINMDTEKSMWEQGTSRDQINWINLSDGLGVGKGVGEKYGIVNYPAYVLINSKGVIIDRFMGYKPGRFEEKIEQHKI